MTDDSNVYRPNKENIVASRFISSAILGAPFAVPCANPVQNLSSGAGGPAIAPGEISNWPMLKIKYKTDPARLKSLLPPGLEPGDEPNVYVTFYNVPIHEAPEYGTVVSVEAKYKGEKGEFTLFIAISQEEPVLLCQQLWGSRNIWPIPLISAMATKSQPNARTRATPSSSSQARSSASSRTRLTSRKTIGGSNACRPGPRSRSSMISRRIWCM